MRPQGVPDLMGPVPPKQRSWGHTQRGTAVPGHGERRPSTRQAKKPQEKPALPTASPWTSSLGDWLTVNDSVESPGPWFCVRPGPVPWCSRPGSAGRDGGHSSSTAAEGTPGRNGGAIISRKWDHRHLGVTLLSNICSMLSGGKQQSPQAINGINSHLEKLRRTYVIVWIAAQ